MSEWIAFMGGLITTGIIWFINSIQQESPYWRGYREGYSEGIKAYRNHIENREETE